MQSSRYRKLVLRKPPGVMYTGGPDFMHFGFRAEYRRRAVTSVAWQGIIPTLPWVSMIQRGVLDPRHKMFVCTAELWFHEQLKAAPPAVHNAMLHLL